MKIGIDARFIFPDRIHGIGRYSYQLIQHLALIDQKNEYLVFKNPSYKKRLSNNENFREIPITGHPISLRTLFDLSFRIKKEKIGVFHSLFPITPLLGGFKHIVTVHDMQAIKVKDFFSKHPFLIDQGLRLFHKISYSSAVRKADMIICNSDATRREFIEYYRIPEEKIVTVYHGIEDRFRILDDEQTKEAFRKKYHLPSRFILNVGNTKPHKNVLVLLKSFSHFLKMHNQFQDVYLVIAGVEDKFLKDIQQLSENVHISNKVIFLGYVPDDDLPELYNCAELFIIVSVHEGFGFPLLESMACGTPVIAARAGALPEITGGAGLMVDPYDVQSVGEAIYALLNNHQLQSILREKGLKRCRFFSWQRAARETFNLYQRI